MHALHLLPQPGMTIDRFVVDRVLGEGGTSVVLEVHNARLGTSYALKLLHTRSMSLQERLLREARLQGTLQHPHVVQVLDIVEHQGQLGIVMERVDGPSLEEVLSQKHLRLAQVDRLAEQILAGVAFAHGAGIIHRDLKPANVLLSTRGGQLCAKVCDFGLAKHLDGDAISATRTGCTLGTPQYMSPEQIRDAKRVDARTDVFALGTMLYEMVTGVHPFAGEKDAWATLRRVSEGRHVPIRERMPHIPDRMARAITEALEPDPAQRTPSVATMLATWKAESQAFELGWEDDLLETAERIAAGRSSEPEAGCAAPTLFATEPSPAPRKATPTVATGPSWSPIVLASVAGGLALPAALVGVVIAVWTFG
ncbi:MAG: serine/threonine protein kinase [Myxococcales bacterium]|nr:serine/threonine protein kinase [Myxococcales bacterium]